MVNRYYYSIYTGGRKKDKRKKIFTRISIKKFAMLNGWFYFKKFHKYSPIDLVVIIETRPCFILIHQFRFQNIIAAWLKEKIWCIFGS